ncbi:MAG TPA: hypothetical protein VKT72_15855, partial [Candidatus Baltobacteraceae bacterium]|nr:hypothetical protein [Candidatus Baltobacteraceae bacterium]
MHKNFVALLLGLLLVAGSIAAQAQLVAPVIPDTPASRIFRLWLDALNDDDRNKLREFYKTYNPSHMDWADSDADLARGTSGFDLLKVVESTPTKFTVLLQARDSDDFVRSMLLVTKSAPYTITGFLLMPTQRPPEFALPHLSQDALLSQLKDRLQRES